jgi:hypothetical protein
MTVDNDSPQAESLGSEGTAVLLDHMFRLWIEPAIKERSLGLSRTDVTKALVLLPPSQPPQVLLNDAVQFVARFRAAGTIEAGEPVTLADIDSIEDLAPVDVDPGIHAWPSRGRGVFRQGPHPCWLSARARLRRNTSRRVPGDVVAFALVSDRFG